MSKSAPILARNRELPARRPTRRDPPVMPKDGLSPLPDNIVAPLSRALVTLRPTPENKAYLQRAEYGRAPGWDAETDYSMAYRGRPVGRMWRHIYERRGGLQLRPVRCSCRPGTEGTSLCNYGRACGELRSHGRGSPRRTRTTKARVTILLSLLVGGVWPCRWRMSKRFGRRRAKTIPVLCFQRSPRRRR